MHEDVRKHAAAKERERLRNLGAADLRVRVPDDVHVAVVQCARELNVSLNAFVVAALEVAVDATKRTR